MAEGQTMHATLGSQAKKEGARRCILEQARHNPAMPKDLFRFDAAAKVADRQAGPFALAVRSIGAGRE